MTTKPYLKVIAVRDMRSKPHTWSVIGQGATNLHDATIMWHPVWKGLTEAEAKSRVANWDVLHPVGGLDPYLIEIVAQGTAQLCEWAPWAADAILNYLDDFWGQLDWLPLAQSWMPRTVALVDLEAAALRPLALCEVDPTMAGHTRHPGCPILLDYDLSVIDGMHRIADAIAQGATHLEAYIRVQQ